MQAFYLLIAILLIYGLYSYFRTGNLPVTKNTGKQSNSNLFLELSQKLTYPGYKFPEPNFKNPSNNQMEDFRLFFLVVADRSFSMFLLPLVRLMIEVSKKIPENGDAVIVPKKM